MTVADLVTALEAEGFRLKERDGKLVITPAASVTPTIKETLVTMGAEVAAFLRERQAHPDIGVDWSRASLYQLDRVIEIMTPWSDTNIVIAPGCRVAQELRAREPKPGHIWCACEVLDLLLSAVRPEDARTAAEAKLLFGGTATARQQSSREAPRRTLGGGGMTGTRIGEGMTMVVCSGCNANGRHTDFETAKYDGSDPERMLCAECKRTGVFCSYCMTQTRAYDPADGQRFDPRDSCPRCRVSMKQVKCLYCGAVREKTTQDDSEMGVCEACDRREREFVERCRTQKGPTRAEALELGIAPPGTAEEFSGPWFLDVELPPLTAAQAEKVFNSHANRYLAFQEEIAYGAVGGSSWWSRLYHAQHRLEAMESILGSEEACALFRQVMEERGFNYAAAERGEAGTHEAMEAVFAEENGETDSLAPLEAVRPTEELYSLLSRVHESACIAGGF